MSYPECHRVLSAGVWRTSLSECAISAGSQLSAHAVCLVTAFSNVVVGGVSFAIGHDIRSTLLLGTMMYLASIGARWLWSRGGELPNFKMAVVGLALGVVVAAGINSARSNNHRLELTDWYSGLSRAERQNVREEVRQWMDKQSTVQREQLLVLAQLMGYETPEDYIVFNFCSPSNKELMAIWEGAGLSIADQP